MTPDQELGFIFHLSMKDVLDGGPVEWRCIPVNIGGPGADGARIACEARDWPTGPVFADPLTFSDDRGTLSPESSETPPPAVELATHGAPAGGGIDRREHLRERYRSLLDHQQRQFANLGIHPDDLDAIEEALDQIDAYAHIAEVRPYRPKLGGNPTTSAPLDEGPLADDADVVGLRRAWYLLEIEQSDWVRTVVECAGNLSVQQRPTHRRVRIGMALVKLAAAGWHDDELLAACCRSSDIDTLAAAGVGQAEALYANVSALVTGAAQFSVDDDGIMRLTAAQAESTST